VGHQIAGGERIAYLVLFRTKDRGKVIGHVDVAALIQLDETVLRIRWLERHDVCAKSQSKWFESPCWERNEDVVVEGTAIQVGI
jgi:hypothetical protein